jgi:hypothetical protein
LRLGTQLCFFTTTMMMILGGRWRSLESFWRTRELLCFNNNASLQCNYSFSPPPPYRKVSCIYNYVCVCAGWQEAKLFPKTFLAYAYIYER